MVRLVFWKKLNNFSLPCGDASLKLMCMIRGWTNGKMKAITTVSCIKLNILETGVLFL